MLLVWRKDIYDSIHRLRGVLGVEGAKDEMPCLCCSHSQGDGLEVSHLPYQDHIRVLPEDVLQCLGEALCVLVYLPLVYDALLVGVEELYWVLNTHYVLASGFVYFVYHGGEGC